MVTTVKPIATLRLGENGVPSGELTKPAPRGGRWI